MATFLVMAGGTGGHVFPALALAEALRARQHRVVWMGTSQGLEATLVPAAGFPLELITVAGLRGRGALGWLLAPLRVLRAVWQASRAIGRVRPALVIGLGGFASGPGGIAAWLARRPLIVHEQNAVPGLTNRVLARFAARVFEAFPGSFGAALGGRVECVGNPVRAAIAALPAPRARYQDRAGRVRLLVIGGSQGAQALNAVVPQALARLASDHPFEVRHQAGARHIDAARAAYAAAAVSAEVVPFIDDIAAAYAWADLVVCRSGAMTVSELAAVGLAAVLVPFPAAADDHQAANARWLVGAGAARLLAQTELTPESLAATLAALSERGALLAMAERGRAVARLDAVPRLVAACEQLAGSAAGEAA
jgi:UDP-N-acetylglucosamine--N-acetylmuramyl-(pentapeptide) pyrophosphoryl-undecaprenol N-acetylglucosamine transferase